MPNRYIRESAIESEAVNSLTWQGEVFYRRLLNKADDFGRYTANHALLRASLFPLQLDKVREADIPRLLAECENAGLLFTYAAEAKQCLVINKWEQGRARNSSYPPPPANICEQMKTFVYTRKHMSANVRPSDARARDSDSDSDSDSDNKSAAKAAPASDSEWLDGLTRNSAYDGIDVIREHAKMQAWCTANRKVPSRRRFINWLNRAEKPVQPYFAPPPKSAIPEPTGWRDFARNEFADPVFLDPASPRYAREWKDLDRETQALLAERMSARVMA